MPVIGRFPEGFIWGAASSAYQIEGYATEDGGGKSIWDKFTHTEGKIAYGDNGDVACDSYHRYMEDIMLVKNAGMHAYRFSTSWARIDPNADGNWNEAGLAYYDKVVDACLDNGIVPYMTLYHWELPQSAQDRGGWQIRDTAEAFGRFAGMMAEHFKGRVNNYFTLNEPQCTVNMGYVQGLHAPGLHLDLQGEFSCWKHQLLAHGIAQRAIKAVDPEAVVGIASTGNLCYPSVETEENVIAARKATFSTDAAWWTFSHQWLLDPICLGHFPEDGCPELWELVSSVSAEEMEIIHTVPDFLGYNIYNGHEVKATVDSYEQVSRYPGFPRTGIKWPVSPEVMDYGVRFLSERYDLPAFISENGLSCNDRVYLDGKVHDVERIDFLTRYLSCLCRAVENGAKLIGYFQWSLTDNFEWHSGYGERFGLVYVDLPSGTRTPKDSYYWYKDIIKTGKPEFYIPGY